MQVTTLLILPCVHKCVHFVSGTIVQRVRSQINILYLISIFKCEVVTVVTVQKVEEECCVHLSACTIPWPYCDITTCCEISYTYIHALLGHTLGIYMLKAGVYVHNWILHKYHSYVHVLWYTQINTTIGC